VTSPASDPDRRAGRARRSAALVAAGGLAAVLAWAVADLPREPGALSEAAASRMPETGVTHPVTGVLLAFRAYDTWLEVCVVLVACVGALAVARRHDVRDRRIASADPLLLWMTALVTPLGALAGGLLLWLGSSAPGGAFQAGAVLGATLLLLWLSARPSAASLAGVGLHLPLVVGAAAFAGAGAAPLLAGRGLLDLPQRGAGDVIVAIEAAVMVSVAVGLALLVLAGRPAEPPAEG
jgi:multisubunit Na+/H+ antiporter MnhB subunit